MYARLYWSPLHFNVMKMKCLDTETRRKKKLPINRETIQHYITVPQSEHLILIFNCAPNTYASGYKQNKLLFLHPETDHDSTIHCSLYMMNGDIWWKCHYSWKEKLYAFINQSVSRVFTLLVGYQREISCSKSKRNVGDCVCGSSLLRLNQFKIFRWSSSLIMVMVISKQKMLDRGPARICDPYTRSFRTRDHMPVLDLLEKYYDFFYRGKLASQF